jgi:hypothetical protein
VAEGCGISTDNENMKLVIFLVGLAITNVCHSNSLITPINLMTDVKPNKSVTRSKADDSNPQTASNGTINFVTFHVCDVTPKSASEEDEITAIKIIDQPKHGGVPYHYIVGNSGKVYYTRSIDVVPASNTYYFSLESGKAPSSWDKTGQITSGWNDYENIRANAFKKWKEAKPVEYKEWEKFAKSEVERTKNEPKKEKRITMERLENLKGLALIAPGFSKGHLTIAFLCDLEDKEGDAPKSVPNARAFESAAKLTAQLLNDLPIGVEAIRSHRECAFTNCPGEVVYRWLRLGVGSSNTKPRDPSLIGSGISKIQWYLKKLDHQ